MRGVDLKAPEYAPTAADEFQLADLRTLGKLRSKRRAASMRCTRSRRTWAEWASSARITRMILHNNSLINLHTLDAARQNGVQRYLYTSSACVYPEFKQTDANVTPLKEDDAYPAQPQDAYGWEKLITERLCMHYCAGLRDRDADRALPQYFRSAGHLGRRAREGSGGDVPQDRDGEAHRQPGDRDLGRRRSRRARSATSTIA